METAKKFGSAGVRKGKLTDRDVAVMAAKQNHDAKVGWTCDSASPSGARVVSVHLPYGLVFILGFSIV